jgi:hypothetical protein
MSTNVPTTCSYEGTTRGDTFRFHSFISHLIEYIEIIKSLKGFRPNVLPSKLIAILLDFRPILGYIHQISNYGVSI